MLTGCIIIAVILVLPLIISYLCYLKTFYVPHNDKCRNPHLPLDNEQFLSLWDNTIHPMVVKAEEI